MRGRKFHSQPPGAAFLDKVDPEGSKVAASRAVDSARTLIAGFGNVLRGDDGFGVEVARRVAEEGGFTTPVDVIEVGTGGIRLVQALMDGYDRLIIVDAAARGKPPGTVSSLCVEGLPAAAAVDMHTAVPAQALGLAAALRVLPREVYIVGCEPEQVDELTLDLSPAVRAAVGEAIAQVRRLVCEPRLPYD